MEELSALAAQGKPVYGPSELPEFIQGVAHRNSVFSQLVNYEQGSTSYNQKLMVFASYRNWPHYHGSIWSSKSTCSVQFWVTSLLTSLKQPDSHPHHGVDTTKYYLKAQEQQDS